MCIRDRTKGAEITILQETKISIEDVYSLADVVYDNHNIGASIASGTFQVEMCIRDRGHRE